MRDFRKYDIWIDSMGLVDDVYTFVEAFPNSEKYGLISQITRSVVSIPSNIAEDGMLRKSPVDFFSERTRWRGGRNSEKDFARFLEIALGSAFELETQLIIAERRKYLSVSHLEGSILKLTSLQKRIYALRKKILN